MGIGSNAAMAAFFNEFPIPPQGVLPPPGTVIGQIESVFFDLCPLILSFNFDQFVEWFLSDAGFGFCHFLATFGLIDPKVCSDARDAARKALLDAGRPLLAEIKQWCRKKPPGNYHPPGGNNMACVNTHSVTTQAQGPGACCKAISASGQTPFIGMRVATTDRRGKCIVCEVKASTSKKNPGAMVIKRGKGGTLCPTTSRGCCVLNTVAGGVQ